MKKKNIIIGIIILILIIVFVVIWKFCIGSSFNSLYKYKKVTRNIDNVEMSLIDIKTQTSEKIYSDTTNKILEVLNDVEVKNTFDSMIGKGYNFYITDISNGYEIKVCIMPTQIKINNKAYDFVKDDEYIVFNTIEEIIKEYI